MRALVGDYFNTTKDCASLLSSESNVPGAMTPL